MDRLEKILALEPERRTQVFKILMEQTRKIETDPDVKVFLAAQYLWAKEEEKRTQRDSGKSLVRVTGSMKLR